jgi:hypothetical protein
MERVATMLSQQLTAAEIAQAVGCSVRTVGAIAREIRQETERELVSTTALRTAADLVAAHRVATRALWSEFSTARQLTRRESIRARTSIVAQLRKERESLLEGLQSLGIVHRQPQHVQIEARGILLLKSLPPDTQYQLARMTSLAEVRALLTAHVGAEDAEVIIQSTLPSDEGSQGRD